MSKHPEDDFTLVENPAEIETLLEALTNAGGASLELTEPDNRILPVLVVASQIGNPLVIDISTVREIAPTLAEGHAFRLMGQVNGKMFRTPRLSTDQCTQTNGRLLCTCAYPKRLEVLQRRSSFRARVKLGMEVGAVLRHPCGKFSQGDLKDLSMEGCQLKLPMSASQLVEKTTQPLEVELCFPDATRFSVLASPRHRKAGTEQQIILSGFRFEHLTTEQERQLWFFVCEIEREAARYADGDQASRLPSPLFQAGSSTPLTLGRRHAQEYAVPMARRLARVAGYLDAQLLELQQGEEVNAVQLSHHADRLLHLHDEDRANLLFSLRCLQDEPRLVRHSLGVSIGLLDLVKTSAVPPELNKALVASALVHDLGKGLLPVDLLQINHLNDAQRQRLHGHVNALKARMGRCQWLSSRTLDAVGYSINERLDGSGYPHQLSGSNVHELTRAAAVVDVVDAMRRDRPDRSAWRVAAIYRHLLNHPEQFDTRWVKRVIKRFGLYPIGSLIRFNSGQLAWVMDLDERALPNRVMLADSCEPPGPTMRSVLEGVALQRLGEIQGEIPVSL